MGVSRSFRTMFDLYLGKEGEMEERGHMKERKVDLSVCTCLDSNESYAFQLFSQGSVSASVHVCVFIFITHLHGCAPSFSSP